MAVFCLPDLAYGNLVYHLRPILSPQAEGRLRFLLLDNVAAFYWLDRAQRGHSFATDDRADAWWVLYEISRVSGFPRAVSLMQRAVNIVV